MKNLLKAKALVSKKLAEAEETMKWGKESIQRNLQKSLLYLDNAIEILKVAKSKAKDDR